MFHVKHFALLTSGTLIIRSKRKAGNKEFSSFLAGS